MSQPQKPKSQAAPATPKEGGAAEQSKSKWKDTLNLPRSDFPMRANLAQNEPKMAERWKAQKLYQKIHAQARGRPKFILHDGPPYANGAIHLGHVLNKVLKDLIVKYRHMSGHDAHYVPGWDCHGLPIEQQVVDQFAKDKKKPGREEILAACKAFAEKWTHVQSENFQRLGVLGDFDHPYKTLDPAYEGVIAREFAKLVREGYVYRGLKPVYWDWKYETALAEAEIEYEDVTSPSIYVAFELLRPAPEAIHPSFKGKKLEIVIWTTTPWTLPANLAVALNKTLEYAAVEASGRVFIVAKDLAERFGKALSLPGERKVLATFPATTLEGGAARHPFLDRESKILFADFVTLEQGTGVVHIAPGHGPDDYELGRASGLPVYCPVDARGCYTDEFSLMKGEFVFKADDKIKALLLEKNALLNSPQDTSKHSYPHSWRSKKPVIFRATSQWFVSLAHKDLRKNALAEIDKIKDRGGWIPAWGRDRIYSMLQGRPDWTLSRQRVWGVPIPAYECAQCGEVTLSPDVCDFVAGVFEKEGIGAWTRRPIAELLPPGTSCAKCKSADLRKGGDILDVWFDSGVSYAAVCKNPKAFPGIDKFPVDLYLEGSDQHRGWFHSSLLTSVANYEKAPYQAVLTHGFVVDGEGRKYSKSNPKYRPLDELISKYGVDILRLWVASEDYRGDVHFSDEILSQLVEAYRKFRNSAKYLLGNLYDFDPSKHWVAYKDMAPIDRWIVGRLNRLIENCLEAYKNYEFHTVYHKLNEFLTVDLSSLYADISKDSLYCDMDASQPNRETPHAKKRRAKQTVSYQILSSICRLAAPVLSFTCEETWEWLGKLPRWQGPAPHPSLEGVHWESVHLSQMPEAVKEEINPEIENALEEVREHLRGRVGELIEGARRENILGASLEAQIGVSCPPAWKEKLLSVLSLDDIKDILVVSALELRDEPKQQASGLHFGYDPIQHAPGTKCPRCWHYTEDVGANPTHPELCLRCAEVVGA